MNESIANIRLNYSKKTLLETDVKSNPIEQFGIWWNEAIKAELSEVNAMTLATASADGVPAARIVLLKNVTPDGFTFYTNYNSFKGQQLAENPKACLVFFWKELERQVRITGLVSKTSEADSNEYFYSRPVGSQIGANISAQSTVIPNRRVLETAYQQMEEGAKNNPTMVTRPEHWGGYIVKPVTVEFWQGRPSRLHDRLQYSLQTDGSWLIERLAP
ncbi:pyridoxamine 5'-phosphate oxidase [Terrimonas rubra]|uniref:Pyridoxine/pyridoxamine 5'-phosphate oxidase n=1 Tax=Terrimonas rubra TaxID=1035890 RepID=A0ABW6A165_9BACT